MAKAPGLTKSLLIALVYCIGPATILSAQVLTDVNLEWRPEPGPPIGVGSLVRIGLYAVTCDGVSDQEMSSMDVIISWNPMFLDLVGVDNNGPYNWLFSGFLSDPFGLNEIIPPQDGDGLYTALGQFPPNLPSATPDGLLVTTFVFTAIAPTCRTQVCILDTAGTPSTNTKVLSDQIGQVVTGQLATASVAIVDPPCPDLQGDMNCDGVLNGEDISSFLLALIDPCAYTAAAPCCDIYKADLNGDGAIDGGDIQLFTDAMLQP